MLVGSCCAHLHNLLPTFICHSTHWLGHCRFWIARSETQCKHARALTKRAEAQFLEHNLESVNRAIFGFLKQGFKKISLRFRPRAKPSDQKIRFQHPGLYKRWKLRRHQYLMKRSSGTQGSLKMVRNLSVTYFGRQGKSVATPAC